MRALLIVATVLGTLFPLPTFACDTEAAVRVQLMLHEMATWYEKNGVIRFKWGAEWDAVGPRKREALIRAFADSEACLTGIAKEINYYRHGRLVGKASPTSGIRLVK